MESRQRAGHPSRAEVTGPLAPYADGFREDLAGKGYHPQVIGRQVRLLADLSSWLDGQGRSSDELVTEVAGEYLRARRAAGYRDLVSALAVAPLLGYLRGLGGVPAAAAPVPRTPVDRLLAEFAGYLVRERGLSPASVNSYLRHARPFLAGLATPVSTALAGPSAAQVTAFMVGHRSLWGTGTAKATVTALPRDTDSIQEPPPPQQVDRIRPQRRFRLPRRQQIPQESRYRLCDYAVGPGNPIRLMDIAGGDETSCPRHHEPGQIASLFLIRIDHADKLAANLPEYAATCSNNALGSVNGA